MPEIMFKNQAKALGLKSYFTGTVCRNGHRCARRTSDGSCYECKRTVSARRCSMLPFPLCIVCGTTLSYHTQLCCGPACRADYRRLRARLDPAFTRRNHQYYSLQKNNPEFLAKRKKQYLRIRTDPVLWQRNLRRIRENINQKKSDALWRAHRRAGERERYQKQKTDPLFIARKREKERRQQRKRSDSQRARYKENAALLRAVRSILSATGEMRK